MATYTNTAGITNGRRLSSQQPMDDRLYFANVGEIGSDLTHTQGRYAAWYEYMTVYLNEEHTFITWLDTANLPPTIQPGAAVAGTMFDYGTVPGNPFLGTKYDQKIYQFYRINSLPSKHTHVEADITDLDKYSKTDVNNLLNQKQDNLPVNSLTTKSLQADLNNNLFWGTTQGISDAPTVPQLYARTANAWMQINDVTKQPILNGPIETLSLPSFMVLGGSAGNGQYTLEDPSLFPSGYSCIIMHDCLGSQFDNLELIGQTIDTIPHTTTTPYIIPFGQSVLFGVVNGQWRRLNVII